MNKNIFIAGIGTDVGKTIVSAIVTEALEADYWKPVQAGELENTDSMKVKALISNKNSKILAENYLLKTAASPHYAADLEGIEITKEKIIFPNTHQRLIIEGAGGLLVPLNDTDFFIDYLPKDTPVILVSQHYLGSINHTLMSLEILKNRGFNKVGVLFLGDKNIATQTIIISHSNSYVIGRVPILENIDKTSISKQANILKDKIIEFLES